MHRRPQPGVGDGPDAEEDAGENDGHADDHKQEAGAAPGMVPGLDPDVFHRQGQARLIAEDGLVLRPVVLEDPVDVLLPGAENQVGHEDEHLQKPLHQIPPPEGEAGEEMQDAPGEQGGQDHEEKDGHAHPQHHRQGHHGAFQLFAGEVLFQPQLEFGGLRRLLLGVEVGGVHQGLHAADHGIQEVHRAPDQGDAQNGIAVPDEAQGLHLFHQLPLLVPDHNGLLLRAPH